MTASFSQPLVAGRLSLRNRLVATAHSTGLAWDGLPIEGDAEYWRRLAEGGAAMAIPAGTVVAPESTYRGRTRTEAYRREAIPGLRRRARAIQDGGAVAICQLVHLGRETTGSPLWLAPVSPSPVRSPREPTVARTLTEDDVRGVVDAFATSAANALEAGFDGVELHAAHGYLLSQFLAEATNLRTDAYGGDLAARMRILVEIVVAIRAVAPDAIVGVRLSDEERWSDLGLDAVAAILSRLAEVAPVDYANLTVGVRGNYVRDMHMEDPPLLDGIARVRAAVAIPLLVCQGFRVAREIEDALGRGADLVGMARPFLADPDLPRKLLAGREADVRPCVSCNEDCRSFQPRVFCSVNPDLAPHGERRRPARPVLLQPGNGGGRRVAIVGAGPGGLECALTLARAGGAEVVVFDGRDRLGGQLAVAADAPHRHGWRRLLDFYAAGLDADAVELQLGESAAPRQLRDFDEIVLATGSTEVLPELDGIERVRTAAAALEAGPEALRGAERLVVVDDGFGWWPGVSAVELGIEAGVERITILTPSGSFANGIPAESRFQLLERLPGARLETHAFLQPLSFEAGAITAKHRLTGEPATVEADAVIYVGERRPAATDLDLPAGARVQAIGDCVVPRRAAHAIAEGRAAAEAILGIADTASL
jgi:2,4-dienoyl-CoA reductase-like NADH-dependent reductase (Old Yellow Enzyme family)